MRRTCYRAFIRSRTVGERRRKKNCTGGKTNYPAHYLSPFSRCSLAGAFSCQHYGILYRDQLSDLYECVALLFCPLTLQTRRCGIMVAQSHRPYLQNKGRWITVNAWEGKEKKCKTSNRKTSFSGMAANPSSAVEGKERTNLYSRSHAASCSLDRKHDSHTRPDTWADARLGPWFDLEGTKLKWRKKKSENNRTRKINFGNFLN